MNAYIVILINESKDPECNLTHFEEIYTSLEKAKECFIKWKENELEYAKGEDREVDILINSVCQFCISWNNGEEKILIDLLTTHITE